MKWNYEQFNFDNPLTPDQIEVINKIISSCTTRIIDWRDETTLWLWLEGKTLDDGEFEL